ncbi:TnsA endonuclease N-terminal domain-containing protein [Halarcobacter ebronensis]|uniref:TnsA endonuclease N-terminal domain-containing protein n=1 Tax=Halarcobacter ebronensis TaxID=1462615 RepID=UPI0019D6D10A|nr:TnsA endonuclease N-terminal domain-containing protein [Halarcobacter ebronensis]
MERACYLSLEFDDSVFAYYEQPQIEIDFRNRHLTYSLDCYIQRTKESGLQDKIIEVKHSNELEKNKEYFEEKFEATKVFTKENDLKFDVFTELSYSKVYIENLDFLYRYMENPIEHKYENEILDVLKDTTKLTAFDLVQRITSNPKEYAMISNNIWSLVSNGKLKSDLFSSELTMKSFVELNHG